MKYHKKPVVIEAEVLTWDNWNALCDWIKAHEGSEGLPEGMRGVYVDPHTGEHSETPIQGADIGMLIPTLEGVMLGKQGDYIIRGVQGEYYPCRGDIFRDTYEPVED